MLDHAKMWKTIVRVHNQTKALILFAEELDPQHDFFWPPLVQQRDTLDHIVRAQNALLTIEEKSPEEKTEASKYIDKQMDKALGHIYRAFFDVADWFSIIIRERIEAIVSQYSRSTILQELPDFAEIVDIPVENICETIAGLRATKDIGTPTDTNIESYVATVNQLSEILKTVRSYQTKFDQVESANIGG